MDRQKKADMMLVLATGFWGISNCLIAICLRDMQPVTLNAFRFLSAFAVLGAVFHKRVLRASRETWRYSVLVGLSLVAIYLGATYGVLYTSVSNAGFIGAMTVSLPRSLSSSFTESDRTASSALPWRCAWQAWRS